VRRADWRYWENNQNIIMIQNLDAVVEVDEVTVQGLRR
jgi:hypothetical protein